MSELKPGAFMLKKVILGQLSLTMEKGTVVQWYKKEGEAVAKGELLYALETDKATQDIEAFDSGFLTKILVREGEEVPVNTVIGYIGESAADLPAMGSQAGGGKASGGSAGPGPAPEPRAAGEQPAMPPDARALASWVYLVVAGSIVGFSAYMLLLQRTSATLASSYSFVNPLIGLVLGATLGGELISTLEWGAAGVVCVGVVLLLAGQATRQAR